MKVILAKPRGFCAGVVRAINIVDRALEKHGAPVYVRHEIVHNRTVVKRLEESGARFVEELSDVPAGHVTVFSAHGVSRSVEQEADERGLPIIDATCPLVKKVHLQARRYMADGRKLVLIGHAGHPEIEGTLGQVGDGAHLVQTAADVDRLPLEADTPIAYVTQTTLSVDDTRTIISALQRRFTNVTGPQTSDICYATQNRQNGVRELAAVADLILVVGARNSSNSNRLREIGEECGVPSHLVEDSGQLDPAWLRGIETVGITAGASAPEHLVEELIEVLERLAPIEVSELQGADENVNFRLPAALAS